MVGLLAITAIAAVFLVIDLAATYHQRPDGSEQDETGPDPAMAEPVETIVVEPDTLLEFGKWAVLDEGGDCRLFTSTVTNKDRVEPELRTRYVVDCLNHFGKAVASVKLNFLPLAPKHPCRVEMLVPRTHAPITTIVIRRRRY
jgi:hypothetical protein